MTTIEQRTALAAVETGAGKILAFDLNAMTDDARASWLAVYELGCRDGFTRGYEAAEKDAAEIHRRAHAVVQAIAERDPYDVLAERRGEHRRAERQRQLMRERGVG